MKRNTDVILRPAAPGDTAWARQTHHAAVRDVVTRQFGPWDETQQDQFFKNDWKGGSFQIIDYRGTRCGYLCVEDRPGDIHLRELVIAPEFQGRGTAVISTVIESAQKRQVPLVLGALHKNRASKLYRHLGFVEFGRTDTHTLFRLDP